MVQTAKAQRVNPRSKKKERMPPAKRPTATARDAAVGQVKFRLRLSHEARRQAMSGPTPMRKTRSRNSGAITLLKYGAPTLT